VLQKSVDAGAKVAANCRKSLQQAQMTIVDVVGLDLGPGSGSALLGRHLSQTRKAQRLTLKQVSGQTGLSISTLSRIENGLLSVTYDNMVAIAAALGVSVVDLLQNPGTVPTARRSLVRKGGGDVYETNPYHYEMLHTDLSARRMSPIRARLKARSIAEFGPLKAHAGEEFFFVLRGEVELHCQHYAPARLAEGDSAYFDSSMGHALLACGETEAEILWIATSR
jgi:transcriptional regulator with XRE-family HTH domain